MALREVKTGKPDALEGLLAGFYDAVLEPDALLGALTAFDNWIGSSVAHMVGWDRVTGAAPISIMTRPEFLPAGDAYANYYGHIDPRRLLAQARQVGEIFSCEDYFDARFVSRNEFYQDLLIPFGVRYVLGSCVYREGGLDVYLVFNHAVGQPSFSPMQRQAVGRLMPHLRQTIRLMMRNASLRAGIASGEAALDALGQGVIAIDSHNGIVFCNRGAEAWLGRQRQVETAGRRLESTGAWSPALGDAIARVRLAHHPVSLTVRTGRDVWHLSVLPMPHAGRTPHPLAARPLLAPLRADLMITVRHAEREAAASEGQLAQLFGLTPAEARLAHALARGLSLDEFAASAAITVTTARNQLRAVLSKSGHRRQQDFVRAVSSLPAFGDA
ncbi:LuxR C-terminal-related transcriptional regulator [Burkholderia sp. 3C]